MRGLRNLVDLTEAASHAKCGELEGPNKTPVSRLATRHVGLLARAYVNFFSDSS